MACPRLFKTKYLFLSLCMVAVLFYLKRSSLGNYGSIRMAKKAVLDSTIFSAKEFKAAAGMHKCPVCLGQDYCDELLR